MLISSSKMAKLEYYSQRYSVKNYSLANKEFITNNGVLFLRKE